MADELIAWSQEHSATAIEAWTNCCRAQVLFHRGGTQETLSLKESFLPVLRAMAELEVLAPSLTFAALMYARFGHGTEALTLIKELEEKTDDAPQYRARCLPDIVRTFSAVGNGNQAQRLLLAEGDVDHARDRHAVVTAHAIVTETRGEMDKALELYGDAAERWADYGFVLEEGQAHLGGAPVLCP